MRNVLAICLLMGACGGSTPAPVVPAPVVPAPPPVAAPPVAPPPAAATDAAPHIDASIDDTPGDPVAGADVYTKNCVPCHQADGTGMGGMLGANFVADKTRLAKTDKELLTSIRDGKTGKIGTMPPWGPSLSEVQRRDALAYIRKTFGEK